MSKKTFNISKVAAKAVLATVDSISAYNSPIDNRAYIAKLSKADTKSAYDFDKNFLPRKYSILKNGNFSYSWDIEEEGVYEIREEIEEKFTTSYFAINHAREKIILNKKREAKCLVFSPIEDWTNLSWLKVQLFKMKLVN